MQGTQDEDRELDIGQMTLLEQQEAAQARQLHRNNMIKKQKGFKGEKAFIAKPAQIAFRDFTVGQPHNLIITLTNVSNAFNSFNVLPLPEKIRNYFEVEYHPKGKISPGISCDIKFTFFPQLNEDIFSEFTIVAETGRISYPIVCTFRKTILRCDMPRINFESIIFGESKKARLTIRNEGSLPSQYSLVTPENSSKELVSSEPLKIIDNLTFERRGDISGNTEKNLWFEFEPHQIGRFELQLLLVAKNDLHSPPISLTFYGECVQVPVRVQRQLYDIEICLLGHVYREKVRFYNRSEGPVSFKMVQPPETKKYFQFNPVIGYIQKQAPLDVWIKFTADKDLSSFLNQYMVRPSLFKIPFQMTVKEQVLPVNFELQFKITSDRVTIRPPDLNFGKIFEGLSSKIQVEFENESELPQELLLYPLKKSISVQNDQPLIKLLPFQTLKTFIIYRSKRLQESNSFREEDYITCRVITGQIATSKLDIHYSCEITRPDLTITHNKIDLPALQTSQVVQAATLFKNNTNKQIIFEIFVPEPQISGLRVTPVVKTLPAKQEVQVNIQYSSFFKTLSPTVLAQVAQKKQPKTEHEEKAPEEVMDKKEGKKEAKKQPKLTKQQQEQLQLEKKRLQEEQRYRKQREEQERLELQRNFDSEAELAKLGGKLFTFGQTQHYQWLLPVYFKQKDYSDVSTEVNFLQITTTSIPQVLTIDQTNIDFGQIAVGTRATRELLISNKGQKAQLCKKNLPIFCSFNVLNSLKEVEPGKPFRAVLQFQPIQQQRFQQRIQFFTDKYTISCNARGKGVRPEVQIEPQTGIVNLGGVLLDEHSQKTVKIKNICNFQVSYCLQKVGEGILNSNSGTAFSYVPAQGTIPAHGNVNIKVRFRPDRISQRYYQKIKVHIEEQKTVQYFYFSGSCYTRQAYATIYKAPAIPQDAEVRIKAQYAFDSLRVKDEDTVFNPNNKTMVLQFPRQNEGNKDQKTLQRKIVVGSCKLLDNKLEKPTNFEVVMPKDDRFQCDNMKGTAAPGAETVITFTYKPEDADPLIACIPELSGIGQWRQLKIQLKVSGGFVKAGITDSVTFEVLLKYYVSQL